LFFESTFYETDGILKKDIAESLTPDFGGKNLSVIVDLNIEENYNLQRKTGGTPKS